MYNKPYCFQIISGTAGGVLRGIASHLTLTIEKRMFFFKTLNLSGILFFAPNFASAPAREPTKLVRPFDAYCCILFLHIVSPCILFLAVCFLRFGGGRNGDRSLPP